MGKVKDAVRGFGHLLAYPLTRPFRDVRSSWGSMRDNYQSALEHRKLRAEADAMTEHLLAEQARTPAEKFTAAFSAWGWNEQSLATQYTAARRARIAALLTGTLGFVVLLVWMANTKAQIWLLVQAAVALTLLMGAFVQVARFAWWEFQIESRTLLPLPQFLKRADVLRRLVRLRS